MQVASSIEYAIRGLAYVAVAGMRGGRSILLHDAASAIHVSESYLRKVFQALARNGIVRSQRGTGGGYALGREPERISVQDVVAAIEGQLVEYSCPKDEQSCDQPESCLVRDTFRVASQRVEEALSSVSLKDIVEDTLARGNRAACLPAAAVPLREERMEHEFCPGARLLRQPKPESMKCPYCGDEVEIWSDEIKAVCPRCGHTLMREGNMSCLGWCNYGRECVGDAIYQDYVNARNAGMKKKLLAALETLFGADDERTLHTHDVLHIAEELVKAEQGDPNIVVPAAILHDVGPAGDRSARDHQRSILLASGFRKADMEQICQIIDCLASDRTIDSVNFRVVHDADRLAGIGQDGARARARKAGLLTRAARSIAAGLSVKRRE